MYIVHNYILYIYNPKRKESYFIAILQWDFSTSYLFDFLGAIPSSQSVSRHPTNVLARLRPLSNMACWKIAYPLVNQHNYAKSQF